MATTSKITIIQGDDVSLNITFTKDGVPFNITGYKCYFTAKEKASDADSAAIIAKDWTTHITPTTGITQVVLTDLETNKPEGMYVWDLQLKSPTGDIASTMYGQLQIMPGVTNRIT